MRTPKIFYTSDLHIGHKLVARERGFVSVDETEEHRGETVYKADVLAHDAWLADTWDNSVDPQDQVFVLGDISINGGQHALDWFEQRPGVKHLIAGNHDPVHPSYRQAVKLLPHWGKYFDTISPFQRRKLLGVSFLLSHFPYSGTGSEGHGVEERHTQYRLADLGMPLLHGHTHGREKHHVSDNGTPQLHVGIDAWGRLVSQDEVQEWLASLSA